MNHKDRVEPQILHKSLRVIKFNIPFVINTTLLLLRELLIFV